MPRIPRDQRAWDVGPLRSASQVRRYFEKSIAQNGVPETVTIDKSGANLAALEAVNADRETPIKILQSKYLNNPRRAGPSGDQAALPAHAGLQEFSLCPDPSGRH
jgi:hypothetical protein